jgi:hypothetical protein
MGAQNYNPSNLGGMEKTAEQVLPRSEGCGGRGKGDREQRVEMAQTMYTHVNKCMNN